MRANGLTLSGCVRDVLLSPPAESGLEASEMKRRFRTRREIPFRISSAFATDYEGSSVILAVPDNL